MIILGLATKLFPFTWNSGGKGGLNTNYCFFWGLFFAMNIYDVSAASRSKFLDRLYGLKDAGSYLITIWYLPKTDWCKRLGEDYFGFGLCCVGDGESVLYKEFFIFWDILLLVLI
jgi:hypothetical protein